MKNLPVIFSLFFIAACSQAPLKPAEVTSDPIAQQPAVDIQKPLTAETPQALEPVTPEQAQPHNGFSHYPQSLADSTAIYSPTTEATIAPLPVKSMQLKYGYYTYDQQRIGGYKTVEDLVLFFPAISGQIFGDPTDYLISQVSVTDNDQFVLQLPRNLDSQTQIFTDTSLNVVPSSASILRVATYHLYPSYNDELGGGGFINSKTEEPLILMYFSEPVQITGSFLDQGETFSHNIKVEHAGWHWIQVSETFHNHFELSLFKGPTEDIEFMVLVTDVTSV